LSHCFRLDSLCKALGQAAIQFNGKDLSGWPGIPRHDDAPADQEPGFQDRERTSDLAPIRLKATSGPPPESLAVSSRAYQAPVEWSTREITLKGPRTIVKLNNVPRHPTPRRRRHGLVPGQLIHNMIAHQRPSEVGLPVRMVRMVDAPRAI